MFDELLNDTITLSKPDGRVIPDIKASVQGNKVYVANLGLPLEEGDEIQRSLPNGHMQCYRVAECVFYSATPHLPGHFELLVERVSPGQPPSRPRQEQRASRSNDLWAMLHPAIVEVARPRFLAGHFADAVEAALKHVCNAVRSRVSAIIAIDVDGAKLMTRVFSLERPLLLLGDLSTESGRSIQQGYMQIFAGAMTGIRNPKAHANLQIEEDRGWHFLFLASLLMHKLDEAVQPGEPPPAT